MSNWYGMSAFPKVVDFHSSRLIDNNSIPVLFGGDFNVVPHTDGGKSIASKKLSILISLYWELSLASKDSLIVNNFSQPKYLLKP